MGSCHTGPPRQLPSQAFCTSCSLCWEHSSLDVHMAHSFSPLSICSNVTSVKLFLIPTFLKLHPHPHPTHLYFSPEQLSPSDIPYNLLIYYVRCLGCQLHKGKNFCLFCSPLCPQLLEQGLAQRGLERRVKWDWISKGFVYQAEELNCSLRTVGNLWRGR